MTAMSSPMPEPPRPRDVEGLPLYEVYEATGQLLLVTSTLPDDLEPSDVVYQRPWATAMPPDRCARRMVVNHLPATEARQDGLRPSSPRYLREDNPGKHDLYIYGQSSADGMACIGCSWQASRPTDIGSALKDHDDQLGEPHDCTIWLPRRREGAWFCPCGLQLVTTQRNWREPCLS